MGQSISPSENYLFLNVMVNFVIVNQKLTGSALHIEKNQTIPRFNLYMISCCMWDVQNNTANQPMYLQLIKLIELRREKTWLRGSRPCLTKTGTEECEPLRNLDLRRGVGPCFENNGATAYDFVFTC